MLDTLLNDRHDVMVSVLGNFDARMLMQLERVSKSFQKNIRAKGVLRTGVLNSFPGITNVPEVTDYEVYAHILRYHYRGYECSAECWHRYMFIALEYAKYHLAFLGGDDRQFWLLNSHEFDAIIADFYERTVRAFRTMKGRQVVLQYTEEWRAELTSKPISLLAIENLNHYRSTEAVINRISAMASSKFCFYSVEYIVKIFPYGIICTNEELIPEVRRHRNAAAAFYKNPMSQSPMSYILSRMKDVNNRLVTRFEETDYDDDDEEDEDDDDEEDEDDDDPEFL